MASNVELSIEPVVPLNVDPKYDIHTQRPRTPNIPYSNYSEIQIKNIKQNKETFFHYLQAPEDFDYNKHKKKIVDFDYTSDEASCRSRTRHNASRAGAYFNWGQYPTPGDNVCKHFHCESKESFTEIDMYRRPPTNRPGEIKMKFGRPNRDYYAPKFPSATTWFQSDNPLNQCGTFGMNQPMTFQEYRIYKKQDKDYVKLQMSRYPNISEYIDRYSLETKTMPSQTNMEKRKAHIKG